MADGTGLFDAVALAIVQATGMPFRVETEHAAGGGCINRAMVIEGGGAKYFVKINDAGRVGMFHAEAQGLAEIAQSATVRVPRALAWGTAQGSAYLVLEYLPLAGGNARSFERLGEQLARMHRWQRREFGWIRDNTIGATPQINTPARGWVDFWGTRRLGYQLRLARERDPGAALARKGERLLADLGLLFTGYEPAPSLVHGDLWGGNAGCSDGEPVVFDPAVYYGDRETDLAMTELFGGFPDRFYDAYRATWPLDAGYRTRRTLYNLYHVLNHFHLFGGGYAAQAERMLDALLAELH